MPKSFPFTFEIFVPLLRPTNKSLREKWNYLRRLNSTGTQAMKQQRDYQQLNQTTRRWNLNENRPWLAGASPRAFGSSEFVCHSSLRSEFVCHSSASLWLHSLWALWILTFNYSKHSLLRETQTHGGIIVFCFVYLFSLKNKNFNFQLQLQQTQKKRKSQCNKGESEMSCPGCHQPSLNWTGSETPNQTATFSSILMRQKLSRRRWKQRKKSTGFSFIQLIQKFLTQFNLTPKGWKARVWEVSAGDGEPAALL